MTDNEIIKALECCVCDGYTCRECAYEDTKHIINEEYETMPNGINYDDWSCTEWLKVDLLDLINRQKAEIERLRDTIEKTDAAYYAKVEELERLKTDIRICESEIKCTRIHADRAKAEAIKEFAERLKEIYGEWLYGHKIDDLVKEMVGDE